MEVQEAQRLGGHRSDSWNRQYEQERKDVLEAPFDRNPNVAFSEEMIQAARFTADIEVLRKHIEAGTPLRLGRYQRLNWEKRN